MEKVITGKKVKMSQIFKEDGRVIPVTIIKAQDDLDKDLLDKEVVVVGRSKGKGFAGVMKRWGFKGSKRSHGIKDTERAAGSIGAQTPGRVFKGKKMAGRMGSKKTTIKGLKIVDISLDDHELMVSGPVPGARNSDLKVLVLD